MNIILYQPDIALNVGAIIRLCACVNINLHIIEPCGFPFDLKKIKKSSLDYIEKVTMTRHSSWHKFILYTQKSPGKIHLLSTKSKDPYYNSTFNKEDYLLFGSESSGVNKEVLENCNSFLKIPLKEGCRSLNLVTAISIVIGEALRQTGYNE